MSRLSGFWSERTPRERLVIASGAALLCGGVIYAYLWLPVVHQRERLVADLPRLRAEAQQMRADAREIESARATAATSPRDLRAAVAALAASPRFSRLAPQVGAEARGRVRVTFAAVSADDWFAWIAALALEQKVRVESAQLEMPDPAGAMKATATLTAGNQ